MGRLSWKCAAIGGAAILVAFSAQAPALAAASEAASTAAHQPPPLPWALPFGALLVAIAVFPLVPRLAHWWEHNRSKLLVALTLGAFTLAYYAARPEGFHGASPGRDAAAAVVHHAVVAEYAPFIVLLLSLYVIAGGLQLRGDLRAYPSVNTAFLGLGALLASFVGTTGASMVLIRPLLQTNRDRTRVAHTVVFFIFLVSNIGGSLLPIGDPPLFLGFLRGVPFFWTIQLAPAWAFCVGVLLAVYYLWDRLVAFPREPAAVERKEEAHFQPLRLRGLVNLPWLAGVIAAVAVLVPGKPLPGTPWTVPDHLREAVLLALSGLSLLTTPRGLRREVQFTYGAILEVAALFLGIFLTMQVPIEILQARGAALGLDTPAHFFWATGGLSSFLDNAPTYVVFFETARALPIAAGSATVSLTDGPPIAASLLEAISLGAVFMGANTYIGNGPNFMVKSIAEGQGVKMPSFFGYMAYSVGILIPLFLAVTWLFLR